MVEPTEPQGVNAPALYSLFCGLIAVPTAFVVIGILFGVFALVLARVALRRAEAGEGRRGMAIAGAALGAIGIVLAVVVLAS